MTPTASIVSDYCLAALLRCHRSPQGQGWQSTTPKADIEEREELLLRWALSSSIKNIAEHVINSPRDIQTAISFSTHTYSGQIPGTVDARETLFAQELTGDSTLFVVSEPSQSPLTRRNNVLAWVLLQAESLVLSAIRRHQLKPQQEWIYSRAKLFEQASRLRVLREVMLSPAGRRRPGSAAIRDARKSLSVLYRSAADAVATFEAIEVMDPQTIRQLLSDTLIAKLEDWQQLELAAALAAAESLAKACGARVRWKGSIAGGSQIATVGPYTLHWQHALSMRTVGQLDPSERLIREAAENLQAGLGQARADITIRRNVDAKAIAHMECKWFGSPASASSSIVDAVSQLVRYCRDSCPNSVTQAQDMLQDSVIVTSTLADFTQRLDGTSPVNLTDFAGLANGCLDVWAFRLHARSAISPI
jgi:hypothetical protein